MRLVSFQMRGGVLRNYIFSIIWRCYGPKRDILDYWGTKIFCLLSYYILLKDAITTDWTYLPSDFLTRSFESQIPFQSCD